MKLDLILEKGDSEWWGRLEGVTGAALYTSGNSIEEVTENLRDLLADYLEHEGQEQPEWKTIAPDSVEFDYTYDLTAFAEAFEAVQAGVLAEKAGIEKDTIRELITGTRRPSLDEAKRHS